MSPSKNKIVEVEISGIAHKGAAVGRTDEGMVVFVEGVIPGDRVQVELKRKRKGSWQGHLLQIIRSSKYRINPVCSHFGICGGCSWQNLDYREQLQQKETLVKDVLTRIAKVQPELIEPIFPATNTEFYRNKLEFTFSKYKWLTAEQLNQELAAEDKLALGFHRPGNFTKIVDIEKCYLQSELSNEIRNWIKEYSIKKTLSFYDIKEQTGFLRNLIIRSNAKNEYLCILSIGHEDTSAVFELSEELKQRFNQIKSFYVILNSKKNDSLFDLSFQKIFGDVYLTEYLDHVKFLIGPKSFFQTNSQQAITLYRIVAEFANLSGAEVIYDLYCGVGSIGIYLAAKAAVVVGVEEIAEAIEDAKLNARINELSNCHFYVSDTKNINLESIIEKHGCPDLIIVDPPRVGLHEEVIEKIIGLKAIKLIYVSCNPATQARDLLLLNEAYEIVKIKPVDMFPHTNHIESVALLSLR